jgi:hypothetical protein
MTTGALGSCPDMWMAKEAKALPANAAVFERRKQSWNDVFSPTKSSESQNTAVESTASCEKTYMGDSGEKFTNWFRVSEVRDDGSLLRRNSTLTTALDYNFWGISISLTFSTAMRSSVKAPGSSGSSAISSAPERYAICIVFRSLYPFDIISKSSCTLNSTSSRRWAHLYHVESNGRSMMSHFSKRYVRAMRSKKRPAISNFPDS